MERETQSHIMDRGYLNLPRLHRLHQTGIFFFLQIKAATSDSQICRTALQSNHPVKSGATRRDFPNKLRLTSYAAVDRQLFGPFRQSVCA